MSKLHTLLTHILVLIIGGSLCASCFDDEETAVPNYNDLILTNVAFGTLPRTMHTKAKNGSDSTFQSTVSATTVYPFTIDQLNNVAYNLDSLPVGTRADKVIFSSFTVKDGSFTVTSLTTGKDTLYATADTLDFSKGPREFKLWGMDGVSRRTYKIDVRIHQQKEDSLTWDKRSRADFDQRLDPNRASRLDYAAAGLRFQLEPGSAILCAEGEQAELAPDAIEEANAAHLPTDNVVWNNLPSRVESNIEEVYLYGTLGEGDNVAGKFWRRNVDKRDFSKYCWEYFPTTLENLNPIPALHDVALFAYDAGLLLVGIDTDSKICVRYSSDRGRTWKDHAVLVLPKDLKSLTVSSLASAVDADSNLWLLVNDSEVWRGRAHKVSWNDDQRVYLK